MGILCSGDQIADYACGILLPVRSSDAALNIHSAHSHRGRRVQVLRAAPPDPHTDGMPVRLHHIVIDAHDLPGLARFWMQALGWKVLSEREREIVIGTDENAPVGMCFMPVTDPKTVKNRVHLDLTSSARTVTGRLSACLPWGRAGPTSGRPAPSPGPCWPTRRGTSSASFARRKRSRDRARRRQARRQSGLRPDRVLIGASLLDPADLRAVKAGPDVLVLYLGTSSCDGT